MVFAFSPLPLTFFGGSDLTNSLVGGKTGEVAGGQGNVELRKWQTPAVRCLGSFWRTECWQAVGNGLKLWNQRRIWWHISIRQSKLGFDLTLKKIYRPKVEAKKNRKRWLCFLLFKKYQLYQRKCINNSGTQTINSLMLLQDNLIVSGDYIHSFNNMHYLLTIAP